MSAQVEGLHWGAEPRFELGAALQQPEALLTEPRRTLTEPRRTLLKMYPRSQTVSDSCWSKFGSCHCIFVTLKDGGCTYPKYSDDMFTNIKTNCPEIPQVYGWTETQLGFLELQFFTSVPHSFCCYVCCVGRRYGLRRREPGSFSPRVQRPWPRLTLSLRTF